MPRRARFAPGVICHVLDRGNGRMRLFHKDKDCAGTCRTCQSSDGTAESTVEDSRQLRLFE